MENKKLTDISVVEIDLKMSADKRIAEFLKKMDNPYFFRANDTPVRVRFCAAGPEFSQCLTKALDKTINSRDIFFRLDY